MFTWNALSTLATLPDTCTFRRFGEVPTTVSPFVFGEIDHGVVVCLRGPKLRRELVYGEELAVARTAGIVEILQELIQLVLIAQRQRDHQIHVLGWGRRPMDRALPS